jgi:hypothetical protein
MTSARKSRPRRRRLSLLPLAVLLTRAAASYELHLNPVGQILPRTVSPRTTKNIPLKITNNCAETLWPGLASQAGTGPDTGGFELSSRTSKSLTVGGDWQGRVWGRTNCSFNAAGTGPSNLNGNNGGGRACQTGDCNGVLSCVVTVCFLTSSVSFRCVTDNAKGDTPVTLAEFDLAGGSQGTQTFYDISLVDGYNLPVGLTYIPGNDSSRQEIPPNLTNCACIGTTGLISDAASPSTNASFPIPYDTKTTDSDLARWCPWDLQLNPPTKPGDGVYPYPDDNIQRPAFSPCLSQCAKTNSPSDCCTGSYDDPSICKPGLYSSQAKAVCPDAYSYAFDDQTSTFIIPSGGGWEVTFCPIGRSTNILKTFGKQLSELASTGKVSMQIVADAQNTTIIQEGGAVMGGDRKRVGSLGALVVMLAWACLW